MTTTLLFMVMYTSSGLIAGWKQMPHDMTMIECREDAARRTVTQAYTGRAKAVSFACVRAKRPPQIETGISASLVQSLPLDR